MDKEGGGESLILMKPSRILDSRPHYTALSCPTALSAIPPSILTWVQPMQAGLGPLPQIGWLSDLRPSTIKILTLPASLAAGGYAWPFGPNYSLILLKPTHILDSRSHYTAPSCPTATAWDPNLEGTG